jgi:hypothetical protein
LKNTSILPTVYETLKEVCPEVATNEVTTLSIPCFSFVVPVVAKYSITVRLSSKAAADVNITEVPLVAV